MKTTRCFSFQKSILLDNKIINLSNFFKSSISNYLKEKTCFLRTFQVFLLKRNNISILETKHKRCIKIFGLNDF